MILFKMYKSYFRLIVAFLAMFNGIVILRCGFEKELFIVMLISFSVSFIFIYLWHLLPFVPRNISGRELFGLLFFLVIIIMNGFLGIISGHEHGAGVTLPMSSFFLGWLSAMKVLNLEYME